jgi:hypothetical protein
MKINILNTISRVTRAVEIPGNEILLGSGIECDIVLEGENIKDQHLRLAVIDKEYFSKTEQDEYKEIAPIYTPTKGLYTGKPNLDSLERPNGRIEIGHYVVSFNGFH